MKKNPMSNKTFTIQISQYVEETAEIEVQAESLEEAQEIIQDKINQNTLEEEYDLNWSEGEGLHPDGIILIL